MRMNNYSGRFWFLSYKVRSKQFLCPPCSIPIELTTGRQVKCQQYTSVARRAQHLITDDEVFTRTQLAVHKTIQACDIYLESQPVSKLKTLGRTRRNFSFKRIETIPVDLLITSSE